MISGTVVNNGVNNGSQAGVVATGFLGFGYPYITGTVFNNGVNNGAQAGVLLQGYLFAGLLPLRRI